MGVVDRKREEKSGLCDCSEGSASTVTDGLAG